MQETDIQSNRGGQRDLLNHKWKVFDFTDVFTDIQRGKRLKKADHKEGNTPYVSSTSQNNGVDGFVGNTSGVRTFTDCLTVANSGSVGSAFYHRYCFVASDHVTRLQRDGLDKYAYLFMVPIINRLSEKYSFNREINDERIKREKLLLPIDDKGRIDFAFMSAFMRELENDILKTTLSYFADRQLVTPPRQVCCKSVSYKDFFIQEIADILSGHDIYERERIDGQIPYITATANNNGIGYFVANINETLEENCLSVNRNGSVGYCHYHPYKALYGNDTRKLRPHVPNKYISLYISEAISSQRCKYGYGYKMGTGRLKRQKIMLPVTSDGNPDWAYMEAYMRGIESKALLTAIKHFANRFPEYISA